MAKFDSILETIGRTPVVRIQRLAPAHVNLYVKLEAFNPLGSVKDRLALGIIEAAERSGALEPGQTVIEATSGNTGIGLAMVCARKGYPLVIVMAENFSVERRKLMRFLGAKVVLTPAWKKGTGMLAKAAELAEKHGWFLCRQFENEANTEVHARTTAREILDDFAGERLDYWVTGAGTGGTLKGVGRVLREHRPETKIVLCEPDNSPMLGSGIAQPRDGDGQPSASHPLFTPHLVQGWTPDFIPKLTEDALGQQFVDRIVPVDSGEAMRISRELATKEGIFTGISGGATFAGALALCESVEEGSTVLCMLPDTGERYLSTPLFDGVSAEMTAEEIAISDSTPSGRWDDEAPAVPPVAAAANAPAAAVVPVVTAAVAPSADTETEALVRGWLESRELPVVLIAFEWCEFSWSVRKLLTQCKVPFRSVDIDSPELQRDGRGGAIRAAIRARTGSNTIPQLFIGGEYAGGAVDVLDSFRDGHLQRLLADHGVAFDESVQLDARALLPGWLVTSASPRGEAQ
jgi:cysteine synthase A